MYKISNYNDKLNGIIRLTDWACIPLDVNNVDYVQFKIDVTNGVELQDADGNPMSPEQVEEFLKTLP